MNKFLAVGAFAILALSGCGFLKGGNTDIDQAVLYAGDVGIGCVGVAIASPENLPEARLAVKCANALLKDNSIDTNMVTQCAAAAGVPKEYKGLVALVVQRINVRMGGGSVFPTDSVAGEAVKAFLASCSAALG